ncbi:MAG: hypothetical protein J5I28_03960 [Acidimicrobiales bacterium]|nr:hypothetical protein [Acidimicrobiales bacterium]HLV91436.1 hypothetical protein [Acidimicrobiia bacterium]
MSDTLKEIEEQLDRIDLAIAQGRLDELELGEWAQPHGDLTPGEEDRVRALIDRIQATVSRVESAKTEVAGALEELRLRRSAARAYTT